MAGKAQEGEAGECVELTELIEEYTKLAWRAEFVEKL